MRSGNPRSVELLLEAGADTTAVDRAGKTALDFVDPDNRPLVEIVARYKRRAL